MQDYEKLGVFYLGKEFGGGAVKDNLVLYDAKDLTTHAMMVGMTGSGKTGLALAIIEEAAIDGIPSIIIDPKGDLGNILLQFPNLRPEDFRPWVDEAEAARKGVGVDEYAAKTAQAWKVGLEQWGQNAERIQRLKNAVEMAVYTPGNTAGRPLQILRSFSAPTGEAADPSALRDRIMSAVSGLLGLVGINADPVQSREHILLSNIFEHAWSEGRSLDIAGIIREIQKPPFDKVGVFDLETFYSAKDRLGLAMALNNLIASPGFSAWMEGEPLDVQRLLYTSEGKPRVSVLYIAHLSDSERMFFVTILLNEVLAWMRVQSGTSSLRALLYMDEIFGYFPPGANPPSKTPMLTLLKQARAFGLGVVLSTQNPVDLDYKGLANCGTWFIGRLQTERDKARVIEGLEGAAAGAGGGFDRAQTEKLLASLGNRVFLMRNVHEDSSILFQTRWTMSYLRGPLTLPQIKKLVASGLVTAGGSVVRTLPAEQAVVSAGGEGTRPIVSSDVQEYFLRPKSSTGPVTYRPNLMATCKLHFVDAKTGLDEWQDYTYFAPFSDDGREVLWDEAIRKGDIKGELDRQPIANARFADLGAAAAKSKNYAAWRKSLETFIYQNVTLDLMNCPDQRMESQPAETEGDFRVRIAQTLREKRDAEVTKLKAKYAPRLQTLTEQLRRAGERAEREKAQAKQQKISTVVSVGATLLGAIMGRKVVSASNIGRATSAMKSAGKIGKEAAEASRAQENAEAVQERLDQLQAEFDQEVAALQKDIGPAQINITKRPIHPRKSDISVEAVGLCWIA